MPLPRPPNTQILKHEQLRAIEAKVYSYSKELKAQGKTHEDATRLADERRVELTSQLHSGQGIMENKKRGQHQSRLAAKQEHMEVFKSALKISSDHAFGEAFDVEL